MGLDEQLKALRTQLPAAIERIGVPTYLVDRDYRIRWLNQAATAVFGDVRGRSADAIVAPDQRPRAREQFARKVLGEPATDFEIDLIDRRGRRVHAEVNSVTLRDEHMMVGVFGIVRAEDRSDRVRDVRPPVELTPRQREALELLGQGLSTAQMAEHLGVSPGDCPQPRPRVAPPRRAPLAGGRRRLRTCRGTPRRSSRASRTSAPNSCRDRSRRRS